jgi:hypothetical protein
MVGQFNTAVGYQALLSNDGGSANTALGYQALYGARVASTGCPVVDEVGSFPDNNTAVGYQALYNNVGGFQNTANGVRALYSDSGEEVLEAG